MLIEEPESHLAAYSQRLLLNVLVHFAVERDLTLIVSSHSPSLFQPLPVDHAVLVTALPLAGFHSNLATAELAEYLRLDDSDRTALVVVEDLPPRRHFLKAIIGHLDHALLCHIAICNAQSGESGVKRVFSEIQKSVWPRSFKVAAILDSDMRTVSDDSVAGISAPSRRYCSGTGYASGF